jgi:hypothetical protein
MDASRSSGSFFLFFLLPWRELWPDRRLLAVVAAALPPEETEAFCSDAGGGGMLIGEDFLEDDNCGASSRNSTVADSRFSAVAGVVTWSVWLKQ